MGKKVTLQLEPSDGMLRADRGGLYLEFTAEIGDILDHFTIKEVLDHFGNDEALDEIGQKEAADYFGLVEAE